jgi:hypothetical protein
MTPQETETLKEAERRRRQRARDRAAEEARRRDQARKQALHQGGEHAVLTFQEWCALNTLSPATGRRIINAGAGPRGGSALPSALMRLGRHRALGRSREVIDEKALRLAPACAGSEPRRADPDQIGSVATTAKKLCPQLPPSSSNKRARRWQELVAIVALFAEISPAFAS